MKRSLSYTAACAVIFTVFLAAGFAVTRFIPNLKPFRDNSGAVATYSPSGGIDENNPFFQSLGTNGRSCSTCHSPADGMGISAAAVRSIYQRTQGRDPIFASVDGANCQSDASRAASAHSMLLQYGLFRISIPMPANAQFTIAVAHDPYGCAITIDPATGQEMISVYRRPPPTTNLRFLSAVMWDGRETLRPLNNKQTFLENLDFDLADQARGAVLGHEQGNTLPTPQQVNEIVQFEASLNSAQIYDDSAGSLSADGASGGPLALAKQLYFPGINDPFGGNPTGAEFNPNAFSIFEAWGSQSGQGERRQQQAREEIAAGEKIFNTHPAIISGVRGLNDNPALGSPAVVTGTCSTCHNTPNAGNHSADLPLDIGVSSQAAYTTNPALAAALRQLSMPDLPVYVIRGCPDPERPGETVNYYTSDPGRALITGQCSDVGLVKGPTLRGLAARAPYFHNGSAATLEEVVNFYNQRFQMNLTAEQKRDLVAFLKSL